MSMSGHVTIYVTDNESDIISKLHAEQILNNTSIKYLIISKPTIINIRRYIPNLSQ